MTALTIDRDYHPDVHRSRPHQLHQSYAHFGWRRRARNLGYLTHAMRQLGLIVAHHEPEPNRISTVGVLRGSAAANH